MIDLPGSDRITSLLTTFLDVQSQRAEIVAGNLANADTPGFKAKTLEFGDFLQRAALDALNPSNSRVSDSTFKGTARIVEQEDAIAGLDGNTVNAGREMSTLAETGTQFLMGTQILQSRLRTLRAAIREGR